MKRLVHILFESTLALMMAGVLFTSCKDDEFSRDTLYTYNGKAPDESTSNLNLTFSESGRLNFKLSTPLLNKYGNVGGYMDCPKGITIISYDNWGNPESMLKADYAINAEGEMRMEAQRNVVITNLKKGDTITTEKIIWDKRMHKIYSDVPVRQTRADGAVYIGSGFDADEKFTKYTVRNPRGEIIADDL
ncbi:MAG: LPS export ABC transporter periplasmic protein LptC [Bacteroidales bacterium]|nr:LPS export ABC transporter periplasmic protein LptC [Bacteroidales bacterium]